MVASNMSAYDTIIDLYEQSKDIGREYLYNAVPKLAKQSPYHKLIWQVYTIDDIHSEMFLFLDWILTSDRERKSKFYYLWNVFHRMPNSLNKILKLNKESYWDDIVNEVTYEVADPEWLLLYIMDLHWVFSPLEKNIFLMLSEWKGPTMISKDLWMYYYKARELCEIVVEKTKDFISKMDKDVASIC